mmetsp:Transcript_56967/g.180241  ORF Transcript_56967/g.180241 Transcript_56967/m.180241 type:complete len:225 (-) Transcript_56967:433-1107(-)
MCPRGPAAHLRRAPVPGGVPPRRRGEEGVSRSHRHHLRGGRGRRLHDYWGRGVVCATDAPRRAGHLAPAPRWGGARTPRGGAYAPLAEPGGRPRDGECRGPLSPLGRWDFGRQRRRPPAPGPAPGRGLRGRPAGQDASGGSRGVVCPARAGRGRAGIFSLCHHRHGGAAARRHPAPQGGGGGDGHPSRRGAGGRGPCYPPGGCQGPSRDRRAARQSPPLYRGRR